jgi:hypothetical protein
MDESVIRLEPFKYRKNNEYNKNENRNSDNSLLSTTRKSILNDSTEHIRNSNRETDPVVKKPIKKDGYSNILSKASNFWKSKFLFNGKKDK